MKRLFVLLLICLLPMQVFAGIGAYQNKHVAQAEVVSRSDATIFDILSAAAVQQDNLPAEVDVDDCLAYGAAGEEPIFYASGLFVPDFPAIFSLQHSDAVMQPPFLPLAGRPPRG